MIEEDVQVRKHRPLVTFALLTYNQESYILEAIEGALSQTYEPLEIILSDDCSTDQTYEIMQKAVADYKGPHKITIRQNAFNLGTALHVQSVFDVSVGSLFVMAAGDDISTKNRVKVLVETWNTAGNPEGCIHSGREIFCNGQTVGFEVAKHHRSPDSILQGYSKGYWLPAAAPTCAYTRDVFDQFGPLLGGSIIEDAPLQLRAALIGNFIACDQPLVRQRIHETNSGTGYGIFSPARWNRFMQSKMIAFRNMQIDLALCAGNIDQDLKLRIERRILAVIKSASGLLLPEVRPINRLARLQLAFKIATAPAVARSIRIRLEYTFDFFGFSFHVLLKNRIRKLIESRRRVE